MAKNNIKDDLANILVESLNKKFSDYKVAYILNDDPTPSDLKDWVSTGSSILDLAISNRPNGGVPAGRILEVTGLEASGKSLIASHIIANTQKLGGLGVYIDTENALNVDFLQAIGVDINKMLYIQLETVEEIFDAVENIISKIRESNNNKFVTIVIDSIAAASTKIEMEADYDKDGYATSKAIIMSKALRKITQLIGRQKILLVVCNQLREKLGVMFGDKYCVDPYTTKIKIKYKIDYMSEYIYEEITLAEFSERFLLNNDFKTPRIINTSNLNIEVLTLDKNNNEIYKPIKNFVIKESTTEYFTDGKINVAPNHRFIENNNIILAKDHKDFKKINKSIDIVDIEVGDLHSFLANGRLNHNTTSGGKALQFHASCRLRAKAIGQIKNSNGNVIGIKTQVQVIKNRFGPPLRKVEFDLYFDSGIDDFGSWLTIMKEKELVNKSGNSYIYIDTDTGEEIKFKSNEFKDKLLENDKIKKQIYNKICEVMIMSYKTGKIGIDDIKIDTESIPE